MNNIMNIGIGKLGRSIYFNKDRRSMTNGDEEAPLMYTMLAKRHPEHTFYLLGRSDIGKVRQKQKASSLNTFFGEDVEPIIPDNIIDLYDDWDRESAGYTHRWLLEKLNCMGVKLDLGIIYSGPMPQVGIPNEGIMRLDGTAPAKSLEMFVNYYAPIMHVLNMTQIPWICLCGDAKYVPMRARDIINEPKIVLSQIEGTYKTNRIASYDDSLNIREVKETYKYAGIETVYMLDEPKIDWRDIKKDIKFTIGLNGGQSRDDFMREWFINAGNTNVKVYGVWSEEFTNAYPNMFEEKRIVEVAGEFLRTRYTIIPPPHKPTGNFVTQKFWKMIHYGIIPFFHPNYDTDKIFPVPPILRVKNGKELYERMDYLDAHPDEYKSIQNLMWRLLDDDLFDGTFLHNQIQSYLKKYVGVQL